MSDGESPESQEQDLQEETTQEEEKQEEPVASCCAPTSKVTQFFNLSKFRSSVWNSLRFCFWEIFCRKSLHPIAFAWWRGESVLKRTNWCSLEQKPHATTRTVGSSDLFLVWVSDAVWWQFTKQFHVESQCPVNQTAQNRGRSLCLFHCTVCSVDWPPRLYVQPKLDHCGVLETLRPPSVLKNKFRCCWCWFRTWQAICNWPPRNSLHSRTRWIHFVSCLSSSRLQLNVTIPPKHRKTLGIIASFARGTVGIRLGSLWHSTGFSVRWCVDVGLKCPVWCAGFCKKQCKGEWTSSRLSLAKHFDLVFPCACVYICVCDCWNCLWIVWNFLSPW